EVIWTHGTMFESDAHAFAGCDLSDRLPKFQQPWQKILEWFIDWVFPFRMGFQFDHRARKTGHGAHPDVRGDLDSAKEHRPREIALGRIEGVLIKGADGGDAEVARFGFSGELLGEGAPVF